MRDDVTRSCRSRHVLHADRFSFLAVGIRRGPLPDAVHNRHHTMLGGTKQALIRRLALSM